MIREGYRTFLANLQLAFSKVLDPDGRWPIRPACRGDLPPPVPGRHGLYAVRSRAPWLFVGADHGHEYARHNAQDQR
jgi:hypothetical protein